MRNSVARVAEVIRRSRYVIAFTGAGISAESGVPTFRGEGGLWNRFRPEELATPEAFFRDPFRVWRWYAWRMDLIRKAKPNEAHIALAKLEEVGIVKAVITQNVDGLHQRAGSRRVIELHGNIWRVRCVNPRCSYVSKLSEPPKELPPKCPQCGSLLRPDVVWFGEPLPPRAWEEAVKEAERTDCIIVVGTSGAVMPAALIPSIVKERGGIVIEINIRESNLSYLADFLILDKASTALREITNNLLRVE